GIIGAMVYLSTLERVRDLAVLKAIGVSTRSLLVGLVFQAVVLALASAALAVVLETAMEPAAAMSVEGSALDFMLLPLVAGAVRSDVPARGPRSRIGGARRRPRDGDGACCGDVRRGVRARLHAPAARRGRRRHARQPRRLAAGRHRRPR